MCLCFEENEKEEEPEINIELIIGEMKYCYFLESENEEILRPEEGNKYFKIYVSVRNVDKFSHIISPDDFKLKDTSFNQYLPLKEKLSMDPNQFQERNISMAYTNSGVLVFEIPNSSTPSSINCNPDWSDQVTALIDPNLIQLEEELSPIAKVSASVTDKSQYWRIDIVKISGSSLILINSKFTLYSKTGICVYKKTISDANPPSLTSGDTTAYPIPSGSSPVNENSTIGDGATVDAASLTVPYVWENCYFCYVDASSDGKVSAGDGIWVFKDYNADGTDDFTPGYKFKIIDNDDNEVLVKEF